MKIAYAGFDLMAEAFRALARKNEVIKLFTCDVDGVYETNTGVISIADGLGVPYTAERITRADIDALAAAGCELLISAGYYYRIPVDSRLPMLNIHPSLLPYGRGAWPMPLAILDRLSESGVTIHKTEESFDTGDILLQTRFDLADDETLESFMRKVNSRLPEMMDALTADFSALWENARPQGAGKYQTQPDPEDYILTARDTADYADRVLRAFYGFPCYYDDGGAVHTLVRCRAFRSENTGRALPLADGYIGEG